MDGEDWGRQKLESGFWYDRFTKYRLMGPKRSLLGAVNAERMKEQRGATKSVPASWYKAATRWNWKARAEAWDASERERAEAEWESRRVEIRQRDFAQAGELRNLAQAILDASPGFIHEREYKRGDTKFVIKALDGRLAVQALEASSKLQRLAAEMADPAQKVDITSGGKTISVREVVVEIPNETDGADE